MADIELENLAESIASNQRIRGISSKELPIENGTRLCRIDESTLRHVMERHYDTGFIIVSANRSEGRFKGENGISVERTRRDNVESYRSLLSELKNSPFGYLPVWGGFRESGRDTINPEPSFVVFPAKTRKTNGEMASFDSLLDFGIGLVNKYNQDSMMVRYPIDYQDEEKAGKTRWVGKDGVGTDEFGSESAWDDLEQEFYTKDARRGAGGFGAIKRWMKGGDPTTRYEKSRRGYKQAANGEPELPSRFSAPWERSLGESYEFFVESPSQTYNVAMIRELTGYDREICNAIPWYHGRFGGV